MESQTQTQPHILVLPYPIQGHINPMLQFSKRLASKGPRVTLVANKMSLNPFTRQGHWTGRWEKV